MNNLTISIFANKIFFEILKEMKLFSKFKIKHYEDLDLCIKDAEKENQLVVFFNNSYNQMKVNNFPSILINNSSKIRNKLHGVLQEQLKMPFKISDFEIIFSKISWNFHLRDISIPNSKIFSISNNPSNA